MEAGLSPSRSLALADKSLEGKLGDDFATVVVGVYDPSAGRLSYSTAGHPVPLVTGATAHDPIDILTPAPVGIGPLDRRPGDQPSRLAPATGSASSATA